MLGSSGRAVSRVAGSVARASRANVPRHMKVPVRNIYGTLYGVAKKVMPNVSATERAALECGTVGFDRELFSGNPKMSSLNKYTIGLNEREVGISTIRIFLQTSFASFFLKWVSQWGE